jgi:hypothetical protein
VNLACGLAAILILGPDMAASTHIHPKAWVSWFDLVAGAILAVFAVRIFGRPPNRERAAAAIAQIQKVVTSRALAVVAGSAALGNAGATVPVALKSLSEADPTTTQYLLTWALFSLVAPLPLSAALLLLLVAPASLTACFLHRGAGSKKTPRTSVAP